MALAGIIYVFVAWVGWRLLDAWLSSLPAPVRQIGKGERTSGKAGGGRLAHGWPSLFARHIAHDERRPSA